MAEAVRTVPNRRWTIGVLLGTGVLVNYFDRISLSVAAPRLQLDLRLSPAELGLLFSAFFWSYSLFQLPGGIVLDRFGIKTVGRWGAFLWAIASGITALASGYAGIFAARLLLGIAEAPGMIGNQKATGYWFPRNERSRSTAIFDIGSSIAIPARIPGSAGRNMPISLPAAPRRKACRRPDRSRCSVMCCAIEKCGRTRWAIPPMAIPSICS